MAHQKKAAKHGATATSGIAATSAPEPEAEPATGTPVKTTLDESLFVTSDRSGSTNGYPAVNLAEASEHYFDRKDKGKAVLKLRLQTFGEVPRSGESESSDIFTSLRIPSSHLGHSKWKTTFRNLTQQATAWHFKKIEELREQGVSDQARIRELEEQLVAKKGEARNKALDEVVKFALKVMTKND